MNDPRVQAMFKRSRHSNLSLSAFKISQDYNELPERTIRANKKVYHIFRPNCYRDIQNLYQVEASMLVTPDEFKCLTSACWDKQHLPLTIDLAKGNYIGRYRLGLNSIFVTDSSLFKIKVLNLYLMIFSTL